MQDKTPKTSAQDAVVAMLMSYDKSPAKADEILSTQFILSDKNRTFRRVCQFIFLNVLRQSALIDKVFSSLCRRRPAPKLRAAMRAAAAEILYSDEARLPKIVDSWVEFSKRRCSAGEAAFANAVLRKFYPEACSFVSKARTQEDLSAAYSHPGWLVGRWLDRFGYEKCLEILKCSQKPSEVFFRVSPTAEAGSKFAEYARFFEPAEAAGFYRLKGGAWDSVGELLKSSDFYIQDPSTWRAASMLSPGCGKWLDLCAAPGGKSRAIADLVRASSGPAGARKSLLVSVDFGKARMARLRQNMEKVKFMDCRALECDLLKNPLSKVLEENLLPGEYDGVFLDAPCSNTGVLRRRPDARYRIKESDVFACAEIQGRLLDIAAGFVAAGGRLVYSTCSIEPEENSEVAGRFLERHPDFELAEERLLLPGLENDGAGHCLLVRRRVA